MAQVFLTNIDLSQNEIQNVVIHNIADSAGRPSTPKEGQVIYQLDTKRFYIWNGSSWVDITGRVRHIIGGTAVSVSVDDTNPANGAVYTINIDEATQLVKGALSAADKTKLDNATSSNTPSTLVFRDINGDFSAGKITATTVTGLVTPVNGSDAVNKDYVDNAITSAIDIVGGIDASTNPNYPAATKGDAYYVTVAGKIGGTSGTSVDVGDMIIAITTSAGGDEATVGNEFIVLENNMGYATESVPGYIEIATQAEVDAGTDTTRAVTPATLATYIANNSATGTVKSYSEAIGANAVEIVTHNLNSTKVMIHLFITSTGQSVEADTYVTDANNITVNFDSGFGADAYTCIVFAG